MYYIWADQKEEDGGTDLYYPDYIRGISVIGTPLDIKNRNRHRALLGIIPFERAPYTGALGSFNDLLESPTRLAGAWAVSPQKDANGINFKVFATLKINEFDVKNFVSPSHSILGMTPEAATEELLGNPIDPIMPVAPV
jgi:hypothetical protein